jgi:hypothetical protein
MRKIMTPSPQVGKEQGEEAVRRLLLGQLRHRRGRLATVGLATLIAAAGFSVLTASASTTSVHVRQTPKHDFRGARSASTKQKVRCASGVGLGRREYACKTRMRLVCHKSPGRTVLRRIPSQAYWTQAWHILFAPVSPHWGANGPPVRHGRLSIRTPRGVRRQQAIVNLSSGAPPGT